MKLEVKMANTKKQITRLIRIGNSYGLIIKKGFLDRLGIGPKGKVQINCTEGSLIIKPKKPVKNR